MVGQYSFSKKTLEFAKGALLNYTSGGVVFLDEAGPLELAGEGYAFCITSLLESHISKLYMVVRENLVDQICERFLRGRPEKL
jgi:nucleoside-triphosphatase THEP1